MERPPGWELTGTDFIKTHAEGILTDAFGFLYPENHWLGQWFQKAYGGEENKKAPCYNQGAVWQLHEENNKEVIL